MTVFVCACVSYPVLRSRGIGPDARLLAEDGGVKIEPNHVRLDSGQVQEFRAVAGATWQLAPGSGRLQRVDDATVRYIAPRLIPASQTVELTAEGGNASATATIELASGSFWIGALVLLWPLPVLVLMASLFLVWPGPAPGPSLEVYPPVVTLAAGASEQFSAKMFHALDGGVNWSASDGFISPAGLFTAPAAASGRIVITATAKTGPAPGATALVLIGRGLALSPSFTELRPAESGDLLALTGAGGKPDLEWFAAPAGAVAIRSGHITIASRVPEETRVVVSVRDEADAERQAAAVVRISPSGKNADTARDRSLIALVLIVGALGAFLGASRSFANFIGNRSFRPSWAVFYLFRPVFGAGLALLVFFGCRTGAVTVLSSSTVDPFGTAFLSGLVGLFADTVLGKLKDVIATMFPTAEPHLDKMRPATPEPDR
jgi:hypothetical protein